MKTLARTLLVWFVLLALPFQGYATAALACAHGGGHAAQAKTPPCHGAPHDDGAQADQQKCGNCAACSVGAAIAPGLPDAAPAQGPRSACPPAPAGRLALADPDLPERPPRTRLA